MVLSFHNKRIAGDIILIFFALSPAIISYVTDVKAITTDLFLRCAAIMVMFAAFLEFRTHEIQALREKDSLYAVWRSIGLIIETQAKTDSAVKYVLRELSTVIQSAGMEPAMGKPEDIKNMVLSEKLKSLKHIQDTPKSYYKYNSVISIIGKILVVAGTIIWAFGDLLVSSYVA